MRTAPGLDQATGYEYYKNTLSRELSLSPSQGSHFPGYCESGNYRLYLPRIRQAFNNKYTLLIILEKQSIIVAKIFLEMGIFMDGSIKNRERIAQRFGKRCTEGMTKALCIEVKNPPRKSGQAF